MTAIELRGVTKEFADVTAVRASISPSRRGGVRLPRPERRRQVDDHRHGARLGPADRGTVRVLEQDATTDGVAIRKRTGVLPDGFAVYDRLTGRQHVEFAVRSKEADDDPDALLDRVGLLDDADRKAGGYSKGMRQRARARDGARGRSRPAHPRRALLRTGSGGGILREGSS